MRTSTAPALASPSSLTTLAFLLLLCLGSVVSLPSAERPPAPAAAPAPAAPAAPAASAAPPNFTGTWHWNFTMPDGTSVSPKIKLKQEGDTLTGTSSLRSGTDVSITNAVVAGDRVQFDVVRQQHGAVVTTHYQGKLDGKFVHGTVESDWAGAKQSYPWEARRSVGIEGTWKWSVPFGGRSFESKVILKLEGDKLTGSMPGRDGRSTEIKNATFKDNEVTFDAERGRGDFRMLSKFQGKLDGDKIKGVIETQFNDGPRTNDWDAVRAE